MEVFEWGPKVAQEAIQKAKVNPKHEIQMHGLPDPNTLINLGIYDPIEHVTPNVREHLLHNKELSNFSTGMRVSSNQVSNWVYIILGTGLVGYSCYLVYKNSKIMQLTTICPEYLGQNMSKNS